MNPRKIIAEVAARYLGVRETSTNRGPEINHFWEATSYPDGWENREPWCSAAVSFWVQEADDESEDLSFPVPPRFPAVVQWLPWAQKEEVGAQVFSAKMNFDGVMKPDAGDIVIFLPFFSHVGVVAEPYDGSGQIVTIEGNTNDEGSREGDGVYRRHRRINRIGSFIRLPARAKAVVKTTA